MKRQMRICDAAQIFRRLCKTKRNSLFWRTHHSSQGKSQLHGQLVCNNLYVRSVANSVVTLK